MPVARSAITQIKTAFEQEGMSPEAISEDLGFELVAVKSALMSSSAEYRRACGAESPEEDELNFTNDELRDVNRVIFETAVGATLPSGDPDYSTRLKAAMYVRDDKKGRKEIVKAVQNNNTNLFVINEALQAARGGAQRLRDAMTGPKLIEQ